MLTKQKRIWVGLCVFVSIFFSFQFAFTSHTAYADYTVNAGQKCENGSTPTTSVDSATKKSTFSCADNTRTGSTQQTGQGSGTTQDDAASKADDKGTTCAIEVIGWILCPIIQSSGKAADFAFQFLANAFLEIEPELLTSNPQGGTGTITAWEKARDLANIAFVIAFVIIIYSQITGSGLNNYGIKRMLPRLVIAAIAVNVSYYICQTLVDLSNILGFNIMEGLTKVASDIGPQVMGANPDSAINGSTASTGGWIATIAIAVIATAGIVWLLLPVLGSIAMFVLVTCIVIILILLLRKAFIVLLVVISPLAFVAYLLPNTEKYFDKWLKMFWQLLMVFPIVALLLGGGQLASTIILVAGATDPVDCTKVSTTQTPNQPQAAKDSASNIQKDSYGVTGECGTPVTIKDKPKQASWTLGLVAAGVAVAPLLAVWSVLQGALSAAGAIGGKIGGTINNMNKGARSRMGGAMKDRREELSERRALNAMQNRGSLSNIATGGSIRRRAFRNAARAGVKSETQRETESAIADRIKNDKSYANRVAGGSIFSKADADALGRAQTGARYTIEKAEAEELKASETSLLSETKGDITKIAAALEEAIEKGNSVGAAAAQNQLMKMGGRGTDEFIKAIKNAESKPSTTASKSAIDAVRVNTRQYHMDIKDRAVGASSWATSNDSMASSLTNINNFSNLSAQQMATQTGESLSGIETAVGAASSPAERATASNIKNVARDAASTKAYENTKINERNTITRIGT